MDEPQRWRLGPRSSSRQAPGRAARRIRFRCERRRGPGRELQRATAACRGEKRRTHPVAVTGYGQPEDQRRAFDAGFDAYLVKPVTIEQLNEMLATARPQTPMATSPSPLDQSTG